MTTKDAYLLEALRLFAEKGYDATGVAEIAKAVGCTTSALYKHFPGKKALFDAIVERSQSGFRENMAFFHICADDPQDRKRVLSMTVEDHVQLMRRIFDS
ncbi:MAG: helix-turn-helix domain containing protein, partial [Oscillospiraceae bacterium]|nr:helix-turn-helix domain containing protein [Oscillospiraceae bacterium]